MSSILQSQALTSLTINLIPTFILFSVAVYILPALTRRLLQFLSSPSSFKEKSSINDTPSISNLPRLSGVVPWLGHLFAWIEFSLVTSMTLVLLKFLSTLALAFLVSRRIPSRLSSATTLSLCTSKSLDTPRTLCPSISAQATTLGSV
ncbi:hypothetical protein LB505_013326 [Fusarium chuoi]|nr:hypothetical protein LB505_013326 [Fusarium chuoi]